MADNNEILIDVQVDTQRMQQELAAAIQSVAALKEEQKTLTKEIEAGNDANGEMAKQLATVKKNIEENNRTIKNHTALLQLEGEQVVSNNMSLDEQRRVLNTLQKAYGQLSGEEKKNADMAGGLRDQIKQLTEQVKEQEHAIGDDRRNVGNYAESFKGLGSASKDAKDLLEGFTGGSNAASKAVDNLGKVSKAFASGNPLMIILALLVPLLVKLQKSLNDNKEAIAGVQNMATSFNGVLVKMKPFLDQVIAKIVDGLLVAIDWVMARLKSMFEWLDRIGKRFGKDWGFAKAFEEGKELAHEMSAEEKKLAEEARKRRFEEWKRSQELIEAERQALELLENQSKRSEEAARKALDAQKKALDLYMKYNNNEEEEEGEEVESFDSMARRWFGLDSEAVEYFKQLLADGVDYAQAKLMTLKDQQTRNIQAMGAAMGELGGSFADLSDALSQFGEENKAAAAAAKAFSMTAILANQAQSMTEGALAIAAGVRQAQSVPFPANLAAIATTVATITGVLASTVSSIAQAKSVLKGTQAFESGGVIGGYTSNPSRHDDTYIHAANGEMVLTASQQRKLFEIANGSQSSAFESSVAAMTAAIAAMPAPVLEYTEFKQFEQKTTTIQEIARV